MTEFSLEDVEIVEFIKELQDTYYKSNGDKLLLALLAEVQELRALNRDQGKKLAKLLNEPKWDQVYRRGEPKGHRIYAPPGTVAH